ncbi:hypothetical protein TIFTF001_027839 [Ficus carica]|uniref:Secreted protein n=1 Tax=Ficus carica TaxID=3494 RepID=A0AA88DNQ1_FICCA|nr:hypothetical protein TIFTF001_027839 [Ficus carica]
MGSFVVAVLMWRVGVCGLLWLVQLASSWHRGNVPSEVPRATSGGRTPKQSVGVFVLLSLASHNVGPAWEELNLDDPEEHSSEDDTRYDSGPMCSFVGGMIRVRGVSSLGRVRNVYSGGSPPSEMSLKVMVYWRGYPLLAIYYGCASINGVTSGRKSHLRKRESPLLARNGMVGEVENTMCLRMDSYFRSPFGVRMV